MAFTDIEIITEETFDDRPQHMLYIDWIKSLYITNAKPADEAGAVDSFAEYVINTYDAHGYLEYAKNASCLHKMPLVASQYIYSSKLWLSAATSTHDEDLKQTYYLISFFEACNALKFNDSYSQSAHALQKEVYNSATSDMNRDEKRKFANILKGSNHFKVIPLKDMYGVFDILHRLKAKIKSID